jgi:hypothetical protein
MQEQLKTSILKTIIMKLAINRIIILVLLGLSGMSVSFAQKYKSTKSHIRFFSDAPMEDIEAVNKNAQSALDLQSGEIVFSVPISGFQFEKSLMQEHFNENYMESEKYPKATFSGKISGYEIGKSGWQNAKASGEMTIHGVQNPMSCEGKIRVEGNQVEIESEFPVELADYKIKIPKVVFLNIAEVVEVTVKFSYDEIDQ